jgi:hypothetical protein
MSSGCRDGRGTDGFEALDFFLKTGKQNGTQHRVRTDALFREIVWETREGREAWEKRQERREQS